jgi:serine/threonine protein kinase
MFLTETDEIKLGDLGFARPHDHTSIITTFIGTYPYISPEVFDRNYSFSTDIW